MSSVWYDSSIVQVTRTVMNDDGTTSEVTELVSQPIARDRPPRDRQR